jgi:signal transduction histidine kinase
LGIVTVVYPLILGWSGANWTWPRTKGLDTRLGMVFLPLLALLTSVAGLIVVLVQGASLASLTVVASVAGLGTVLALVRHGVLIGELHHTLDTLHRTQHNLIQSEKLAALGQLIAGVAHDLNSPLGAIRSATSQIQTILEEHWSAFLHQWEVLDPQQRAWTRQAMADAPPEHEYSDGRRERAFRKELKATAEAANHPDPGRLADAVTEAGLIDRPAVVEELFTWADPFPVLEVLAVHRNIRQLVAVSVHASDRASVVINAIQHYLYSTPPGKAVHFEASETIRRILPLFQHRVRQGVTLETDLEEGLILLGWPDKLTQVWVNLITNAFHAVGSRGRIAMTARRQPGEVLVTVEDDGPGISLENARRIFDPLFTTKAPGEGTGLGLDVCRRVVEEAGGRISFESKPGRTVFSVRIPAPS